MSIARTLAAAVCLAGTALCQPPLTTIQDVIYKADGTRLNGLAFISWNGFEASNSSNIATQSVTAQIVNGNLLVRLAPTTTATPAGTYSVTYNSDGKVQFQETWSVPPSPTPLRVRDVRAAAPPQEVVTLPIQESDVVNLPNDLAIRPVKGPGFAVGRSAWINAAGGIEAVTGNPSDCVRVDGTSTPCGQGSVPPPDFIDQEAPSGIVDGSNGAFTLAGTPDPAASLEIYRNGLLQRAGFDYSLTGNAVQFLAGAIPQPGDTLLASYRLTGLLLMAEGPPPASAARPNPAPEVLCGGSGAGTAQTVWTTLASCTVPAAALSPGGRMEILFDYSGASGYEFQVLCGSTTILQRTAQAMITGRAGVSWAPGATQLSAESWGSSTPLAAVLKSGDFSLGAPLTIAFQGRMQASGSAQLSLRSFSVIHYPAIAQR